MIRDFFYGLSTYSEALGAVKRYGLTRYMFITGVISLALASVIIWSAFVFAGDIGGWMISIYPWEWGKSLFLSMASFISGSFIVALSFMIYKYLILIIVSPFMSPLSEKIERSIKGSVKTSSGIVQSGKGFIRGLRLSIRNFLREILITIAIFMFGLIPVVGLIAPFLLFAVQAYYVGFGNLDYFLERHFSIKGSVGFVKRHKGLAVANGGIFLVLIMIPIVGLFIAPALATTAATIAGIRRMDESYPSEINL